MLEEFEAKIDRIKFNVLNKEWHRDFAPKVEESIFIEF